MERALNLTEQEYREVLAALWQWRTAVARSLEAALEDFPDLLAPGMEELDKIDMLAAKFGRGAPGG